MATLQPQYSPDKAGAYDKSAFPNGPAEDMTDGSSGDYQIIDPDSGVKRGLKTRHISMIALAGEFDPHSSSDCDDS